MDPKELRGLYEAYSEVYAPIDEAEKPFPHEKVKAKQVALRDKSGNALDRRMKMGMAVRRAKEAEKTGGSQRDAGKGWYHAKEELEIFDVVLEFLQAEGYADTLEEAEWVMANLIDEEAIGIILGEAIYSEKGKAKAAEMIAKRSTPSGRAKSGKGANVAQIRQIRGSGRGYFDREGLGGTPMTPTMAKNPIKKQSDVGTGNKAARRAGLTPTREKPNAWKEEFELWVDALVEEGYDLSDYTWDDMYEFYLDEAEKPFPYEKVTAQQKKHTAAGRYGNMMKMGLAKRRAKEAEKTGGSQRDAGKGWYHAKEEFEAWFDEAMSNYEKNRKRAAQRAAARNAARDQGKTGAVPGVGYVTPRRERETWTDESGKTRHAKGL
jgi:hypothetical protein